MADFEQEKNGDATTIFILYLLCWGLPPFVSPNNLKSRSHNIRDEGDP